MESIAIIGMACRFPGAQNLSALWDLLTRGGDAISEVPQDRYDINAYYDKRPATPGKTMSRYGGFLERVDLFDAAFFGISPREAAKIDPQHRLLMEVAWEAMEDAGLVPASMTEQEKLDIACFIGVITGDYWDRQFQDAAHLDVYATAGSARSGAAGRLSFSLDLKGTSFAIDAACSSSLVGVDQAVHTLRAGIYSTALVGGVNIILNPDHAIGFSQGKMMAADGHCKAFDVAADGYVRSEGAGIVVLKRLSCAQADGDRIYAIIPGSASNNDGHCDSFMAPSTQGQQAGLRKACQNAGIDPLSINYVEAHGPGTKAGDPVEIKTLGEVLCPGRPIDHPLLVGSVKTNIGHLEGAAGVAGLIKTVLSLIHKKIPGNLHFNTPSPSIDWTYPVKIPTELTPWPDSDEPHRAVVCSYGIAGTNTYVVVEEAPPQTLFSLPRAEELHPPYFLPLSARSSNALTDLAQRYVEYLEDAKYAEHAWYDICYTAGARRTSHDHRLAIVSYSKQEACKNLKTYLRGETSLALASGQASSKAGKIAWIFPGQGSQWLGMGRNLLAQEPVFYSVIEQCDQIMRSYVDWSLLDQLQSNEELKDIDVIQPVLFAIEIALGALWRFWGIEPNAVVGHSMGETAAAYVAGVLSLDDAISIICRRSKLLRRTSGQGAMAAVELSLDRAQTIVHDYKERVSVAVSNSPNSTVLSGDPVALKEILAILEQQGIFGRLVNVDVASHSPQMDPLRDDLLSLLEYVQPGKTLIPLYSTVYGALVVGDELNAEYWMNNLRQPVLFLKTIQTLLEDGFTTFIEMSPHPILVGAIRQTMELSDKPALTLASMRRNEPERAFLLTALGTLYAHGYNPNWKALYASAGRHVSLPSYPWQHQSYWNTSNGRSRSRFTSSVRQNGGTLIHPILGISTSSALHANTTFWTTDIDAEIFPYLSEHRVHGMPVFPGAAYIELALAAATEVFGSQRFSIEDLRLKKALFFPAGTTQTIQVTLSPETEEGTICLQLFSKPAKEENEQAQTWVLHAIAHVRPMYAEEMLKTEDIVHPAPEQVQNEWTLAQEAAEFYQGLRARGVQHGPLFQSVTQIWRRSGEVMARLSIPQELADDMAGYQLHPALLDAILQGSIPFLPTGDGDETYVPVTIKQVKLYQKPTPGSEIWSHVIVQSDGNAATNTLEVNVILLNDQGQVLLEVLGLCLQSLDSNNTQDMTDQRLNQLLYTIEWEAQGITNQLMKGNQRKNWLVLSERHEPGNNLVRCLRAHAANCIMVIPGQAYRQVEEQVYELNPADPQEFQRLFSELYSENVCHGIVYLWPVSVHEGTWPPPHHDQDMASIGVLHLLQALTTVRKEATLPPRLWLVTSGVHTIEEKDRMTALIPASVWGLGRVIVYEYPDLQTTLIDIDARSPMEESFKALFEELWLDDDADEVALRADRRYVARLVRQVLPDEQEQVTSLFRVDGTYLITGGLGGVGLRTAQWMIEQGARHIVLMGRHGATEETLSTVQALRDRGAAISIIKADVAQEEQLATALADIRSTLPPLRGIFHSAVVLDDSILQQLDRQRFLSVMPPKVDGTWNLHCLTLGDPLDYFVLFSSAASLIGSPGQGNYAAASAFMDALAYYRKQQGYPALTINWGRWGEVGQATKENRGERLDTRGFASMKSKDALTILGKLLQSSWQGPQIGIMSFNLSRWSQFFPRLLGSSLFVHLLEESETQEATNGAKELHPTREIIAELDEEQRLHLLSHYLSDKIAKILGHTSLNLDAHQPLSRLGIDSLMSVELKNRIASDLNVVIPVAAILQGITFGELIKQVLEQMK